MLKGERVRAAAVLAAIATEGTLWEVSGYMVDLLPLPILLEALAVALSPPPEAGKLPRRSAVLGLLLGTAVALKLTNLVFAVPIGLVALVRWRSGFGSVRPAIAALGAGALAFILPVAPHALVLTARHGNPVFPHFNARFQSPDFPPLDIKDLRWGPVTARPAGSRRGGSSRWAPSSSSSRAGSSRPAPSWPSPGASSGASGRATTGTASSASSREASPSSSSRPGSRDPSDRLRRGVRDPRGRWPGLRP
ncbi:MAG TPA: hypothetical protein PKA62_13575, partial [Thermoanaerobaculia bacterium]|nr:hypothetical protein [Thermoanaerobaculia bacterium]